MRRAFLNTRSSLIVAHVMLCWFGPTAFGSPFVEESQHLSPRIQTSNDFEGGHAALNEPVKTKDPYNKPDCQLQTSFYRFLCRPSFGIATYSMTITDHENRVTDRQPAYISLLAIETGAWPASDYFSIAFLSELPLSNCASVNGKIEYTVLNHPSSLQVHHNFCVNSDIGILVYFGPFETVNSRFRLRAGAIYITNPPFENYPSIPFLLGARFTGWANTSNEALVKAWDIALDYRESSLRFDDPNPNPNSFGNGSISQDSHAYYIQSIVVTMYLTF